VSELLPEGENVRRALRWIAERRREEPEQKLGRLLDQAMRRFDLSPIQCERLLEHYRADRAEEPRS